MKENGICLCEYVAFAAIIDILFSSSKIAKLKRDEPWCVRSEGVHKLTTKTCGCSLTCAYQKTKKALPSLFMRYPSLCPLRIPLRILYLADRWPIRSRTALIVVARSRCGVAESRQGFLLQKSGFDATIGSITITLNTCDKWLRCIGWGIASDERSLIGKD